MKIIYLSIAIFAIIISVFLGSKVFFSKTIEEQKQDFVNSIVKEIKVEIEEYAKNHNGNIPYMDKNRPLVKLVENPLFDKMLLNIFTKENPSEHGITLIGQCASKSAKKIVSLDEKTKTSFNLKYISKELQKELNILMYDKRHKSFKKLFKALGK